MHWASLRQRFHERMREEGGSSCFAKSFPVAQLAALVLEWTFCHWLNPNCCGHVITTVAVIDSRTDRADWIGTTLLGGHTCIIQFDEEADLGSGTTVMLVGFASEITEHLHVLDASEDSERFASPITQRVCH